jgi:hemerythrin superfamily protein
MAASTKGTSKSSAKSGLKTDMTTKATSKTKSATKVKRGSASRVATEKSGTSKRTNSGGTKRTASHQAEPTKSKQAKAASSRMGSASKAGGSRASKSRAGNGDGGVVSKMVGAVGGLLKGRQTDAIDMLKKDHRRVEELFEKVKANEDGNNRAVFKRIKSELDVHTHIEEKIFYPFMLKKGDEELQKIVREGFEEHRQAKTLLAELNEQTGTSELFKARIKVLMENIEHHVEEEEGEMFPMVEDQFDGKTREKLGARMQAEKVKFKEQSATRSTAAHKAAKTRAAAA